MLKARKLGVRTPVLYHTDYQRAGIFMEHIAGTTVKQLLHSGSLAGEGVLVEAVHSQPPPAVTFLWALTSLF